MINRVLAQPEKGALQFEVDPQLMQALEHYAKAYRDLFFGRSTDDTVRRPEDFVFVAHAPRGRMARSFTIHETLRLVLELLHENELAILRLRHLQAEMKRMRLDYIYERIFFGEKLPD
jgi:hypothetical protein